MKKVFTLMSLFAIGVMVSGFTFHGPGDAAKYIGSDKCKGCHTAKGQWKVYEASAHFKALDALKTPAADEIAAKRGSKVKAIETPECLGCHQTGRNVKDAAFDEKFPATEGVGCESCHGAGSGYKMLHMKKESMDKAVAAGMHLPKVADGSAEKQCVQCHNEKSPTFKGFKFAEAWKAVAHPIAK